MASAAEDIVEMITGRISPTSDALQLSEPLDKLGLDSMQVVELIFDIEEKFDIQTFRLTRIWILKARQSGISFKR